MVDFTSLSPWVVPVTIHIYNCKRNPYSFYRQTLTNIGEVGLCEIWAVMKTPMRRVGLLTLKITAWFRPKNSNLWDKVADVPTKTTDFTGFFHLKPSMLQGFPSETRDVVQGFLLFLQLKPRCTNINQPFLIIFPTKTKDFSILGGPWDFILSQGFYIEPGGRVLPWCPIRKNSQFLACHGGRPVDPTRTGFDRISSHRVDGAGRKMLTWLGFLLMGSMSPYIAAPWIRHGHGI